MLLATIYVSIHVSSYYSRKNILYMCPETTKYAVCVTSVLLVLYICYCIRATGTIYVSIHVPHTTRYTVYVSVYEFSHY